MGSFSDLCSGGPDGWVGAPLLHWHSSPKLPRVHFIMLLPGAGAAPSPASSGGLETVYSVELPYPPRQPLSSLPACKLFCLQAVLPAWNTSLSHPVLSFSTCYHISRLIVTNSKKASFPIQPSPLPLILSPSASVLCNLVSGCALCRGADRCHCLPNIHTLLEGRAMYPAF